MKNKLQRYNSELDAIEDYTPLDKYRLEIHKTDLVRVPTGDIGRVVDAHSSGDIVVLIDNSYYCDVPPEQLAVVCAKQVSATLIYKTRVTARVPENANEHEISHELHRVAKEIIVQMEPEVIRCTEGAE
jgi:hypothetical protein